jgi:hypothetical protein
MSAPTMPQVAAEDIGQLAKVTLTGEGRGAAVVARRVYLRRWCPVSAASWRKDLHRIPGSQLHSDFVLQRPTT